MIAVTNYSIEELLEILQKEYHWSRLTRLERETGNIHLLRSFTEHVTINKQGEFCFYFECKDINRYVSYLTSHELLLFSDLCDKVHDKYLDEEHSKGEWNERIPKN